MRADRIAVGRAEDRPAVDETIIVQLASITDGQGFSVLGELPNAFLAAVPGRLETLDRALADGELRAMADQSHALTGRALRRPKIADVPQSAR